MINFQNTSINICVLSWLEKAQLQQRHIVNSSHAENSAALKLLNLFRSSQSYSRISEAASRNEAAMTGIHLSFTEKDAAKLLVALLMFEVLLVTTYLLGIDSMPLKIGVLFDLDRELTIPAWFSSMQLLLIGILFLFSSHWPERHLISFPKFLYLAGIGFIFLSMDEAIAIHERLTSLLGHMKSEWTPSFKGGFGTWMAIYIPILMGLMLAARRTIPTFFKAYPHQARILLAGATIFVLGAVVLEIVSYLYLRDDEASQIYKLEVALEEFFEMAGASLILYGTILCAYSDKSKKAE